MKLIEYISQKERKLLLTLGLATFIFSVTGFITYNVKEDLKRADFYRMQDENMALGKPTFSGPYCYPDNHPQLLLKIAFFSALTFLLLIFSKRYVLSSLSTMYLLGLFMMWFAATRKELVYDEFGSLIGIDRILYKAGDFDLTVCLLALILLFWQFSILLRMLIKNTQRKNVLP